MNEEFALVLDAFGDASTVETSEDLRDLLIKRDRKNRKAPPGTVYLVLGEDGKPAGWHDAEPGYIQAVTHA